MDENAGRRVLLLLAVAELLAMSLWFTGTVVLPQLAQVWGVALAQASWLTLAVQLGFVAGALVSAVFNLSDVYRPSRLFWVCALLAAGANALFAWAAEGSRPLALVLRFLTGAFLAGVYPPGMKLLSGWFKQGRGLALGVLVGALTVGSALPHAVHAAGGLPWRGVVLASSVFALLAAALVAFGVHEGPYAAPPAVFDLRQAGEVFRNRRLRLATFGYLGHMWELYSMWGWIAVMFAAAGPGRSLAAVEWAAFGAVAIGFLGCVWAGRAADRLPQAAGADAVQSRVKRRADVTIVAMAVSGGCCVLAALAFDHFGLLVAISLVWGVAVIADSAQFSAIISEVAESRYVGTALTLQTAVGFLLTTVSVRAVAAIGTTFGWRWAAASMAVGPALGIVAMLRLARGRG
jgi:MFS family permease